jgi:hypothetical protein
MRDEGEPILGIEALQAIGVWPTPEASPAP